MLILYVFFIIKNEAFCLIFYYEKLFLSIIYGAQNEVYRVG